MFGLWINAQEAEKCSKIIATAQSHQIIVVKVMVVSTCIHRKFPVDEQITRCSRTSHWLKWQCLVTWVMRTSIAQRLNNYLWLMRERGRSMRWWKQKDTSTHSHFFASCAKTKPVCVDATTWFCLHVHTTPTDFCVIGWNTLESAELCTIGNQAVSCDRRLKFQANFLQSRARATWNY